MRAPLSPKSSSEPVPEGTPQIDPLRTVDTSMHPVSGEKVDLDDLPARVAERAPENLPEEAKSLARFILVVVAAFFILALIMMVARGLMMST